MAVEREKVWLSKGKPHMDKNQNKMQRGFTENCQTLLLLLHHRIVGSTGSIDHLKCR
jgi:hypothetical protein